MNASGSQDFATVVVARKVRPELAEAYEDWQSEILAATSRSPGFIGKETIRPVSGVDDDWVTVFRFDSKEHLLAWMQSEERRELLERGDAFNDAPADEHTMIGGRPTEHYVTLVVSSTPNPGHEKQFLAAEKALEAAVRSFRGFTGYELLKPVHEGGAWTSLIRFEDTRSADEWLRSEIRTKLLENLHKQVQRISVRKVPSAFGSWFSFSAVDGANTPNWKQSMTVLLALYPTTMCLHYLTSYLQEVGIPGYLRIFASNTLSVIILGFLLMPVVTRALRFWLDPGASTRITIRGTILAVILYGMLLGFWGLLTRAL